MSQSFDPTQEDLLRETIERGEPPICPFCMLGLRSTPVPPRSDVSYVRRRVVLECDSCGRRAAIDLKP